MILFDMVVEKHPSHTYMRKLMLSPDEACDNYLKIGIEHMYKLTTLMSALFDSPTDLCLRFPLGIENDRKNPHLTYRHSDHSRDLPAFDIKGWKRHCVDAIMLAQLSYQYYSVFIRLRNILDSHAHDRHR